MTGGRKISFDRTETVDKFTKKFWENGFSGTSIAELVKHLGINKPSIYNAFGNKEELYASSLEHYFSHYYGSVLSKLSVPEHLPLCERLRNFLYASIDLTTSMANPSGCFFINSSCESSSSAMPKRLKAEINKAWYLCETMIKNQLISEQKAGQLDTMVDVGLVAASLMSTIAGLAVQSQHGQSKQVLQRVADIAVDSIPGLTRI